MAVTKALIKSRAADDRSTGSILTHVNDELSQDNPSSMFVTVFAAILNIATGELTYTNAGHNPPYVKHPDGSIRALTERHGPIVGAMSGIAYGEESSHLSSDDVVIMFTDGVTEAMDVGGNLYSDARLEKLLQESQLESVEAAVDTVLSSVKRFETGAEQADDITILCLSFNGA
jgi:sigma-B regulation protein RsbU (phosphoserine phosphatase)